MIMTFNCPLYSRGDEVVRIEVIENTSQEKHTNRAPAKILIESYYHPLLKSLELSFLSNLGAVTVSLENLTTGEIQEYAGNSSIGAMVIPVVSNSEYRMDIVIENGRSYFAQFFAGENDMAY